jgi:D-3-phosphoglycerate dehydrogenase
MKQGVWDKKSFLGEEIRGKVLGLAGLGRIGQEVARRARAFEMTVIAHDPFIAAPVAEAIGVELVSMDDLCARSDFLSLHMPSTPETRRTFNADRLARSKRGIRIINTARGDLIDEAALAAAIASGQVGGAALDVFEQEPTKDHTLQMLPAVVASPHIAASTREGQELVGVETVTALKDFLKSGLIRNAVNFPAMPTEEFRRLLPYITLADQLGCLLGQMGPARVGRVGVRYYGDLVGSPPVIGSYALVGLFRAILSSGVTAVNARAVAAARGIDVVESSSSRERAMRSMISVKVATDAGERWAEGTVVDGIPRLVLLNGVQVEAPLAGPLMLIASRDQPGVIGHVGTILGRHDVNIGNFALGRNADGAMSVITLDDPPDREMGPALAEVRAVANVKDAWFVRLSA